VAPVSNEKGKTQPEYVDKHHEDHYAHKEPQKILPKQFFQRVPGEHGKDKIHGGNEQGAEHIRRKEFPVGPVIGRENSQGRTVEIPFFGLILMPHGFSVYQIFPFDETPDPDFARVTALTFNLRKVTGF
jgi:hypothetical protein